MCLPHLKKCFCFVLNFRYDIFAINLASVMLGYAYGHTQGGTLTQNVASCGLTLAGWKPLAGPGSTFKLSNNQDFGLKVAAPIGNLFGQLLFGWLADIVGRKRMCMLPLPHFENVLITSISDGIELMIIVTATFAQALAGSGLGVNIIGVLMVWRFIMGVGVGGDYPLSAVISSEFASTSSRGRLMTTVFTAQGWGNFGKQHCSYVRRPVTLNSVLS